MMGDSRSWGVLGGEPPLRQPGAQRFIAEHAAVLVLDALRGAAQQKTDVPGFTLEHVVVHGQDFFIIALPRHCLGDLVQIDQLVHNDQQSLISGMNQEGGKNF